jgi:hypothetical protein
MASKLKRGSGLGAPFVKFGRGRQIKKGSAPDQALLVSAIA